MNPLVNFQKNLFSFFKSRQRLLLPDRDDKLSFNNNEFVKNARNTMKIENIGNTEDIGDMGERKNTRYARRNENVQNAADVGDKMPVRVNDIKTDEKDRENNELNNNCNDPQPTFSLL